MDGGADAVAMAGGDGSQAVVATAAAKSGAPLRLHPVRHAQPLRPGPRGGSRRRRGSARRLRRRRRTPRRPRRGERPGVRQQRVAGGLRGGRAPPGLPAGQDADAPRHCSRCARPSPRDHHAALDHTGRPDADRRGRDPRGQQPVPPLRRRRRRHTPGGRPGPVGHHRRRPAEHTGQSTTAAVAPVVGHGVPGGVRRARSGGHRRRGRAARVPRGTSASRRRRCGSGSRRTTRERRRPRSSRSAPCPLWRRSRGSPSAGIRASCPRARAGRRGRRPRAAFRKRPRPGRRAGSDPSPHDHGVPEPASRRRHDDGARAVLRRRPPGRPVGRGAHQRTFLQACGGTSWWAGTTNVCNGSVVYRDYVNDDHGADTGGIGYQGTQNAFGTLAHPAGDQRYAADRISVADLVDLTLTRRGDRVDVVAETAALYRPGDTVLALAIDTDGNAAHRRRRLGLARHPQRRLGPAGRHRPRRPAHQHAARLVPAPPRGPLAGAGRHRRRLDRHGHERRVPRRGRAGAVQPRPTATRHRTRRAARAPGSRTGRRRRSPPATSPPSATPSAPATCAPA